MMKIGFSSQACPDWDLETIVAKASAMGFDGVELQGMRGESGLPLVPELTGQPERVLLGGLGQFAAQVQMGDLSPTRVTGPGRRRSGAECNQRADTH